LQAEIRESRRAKTRHSRRQSEAAQTSEPCEKALIETGQARERCKKTEKERDRAMEKLGELKAEVKRFLHEGGRMQENKEMGSHSEENGKERGSGGEGDGFDERDIPEESRMVRVGKQGTV
jgi:hypothetical protein